MIFQYYKQLPCVGVVAVYECPVCGNIEKRGTGMKQIPC